MKKTIALLAIAASTAAYAQIVPPLPPTVAPTPDAYSNAPLWDSQLNNVTVTGDANTPIGPLAAADGITLGGFAPGAVADMIAIRVIYFGESAGFKNDFGYTFGAPTVVSGPPSTASTAHASARTLAGDIDSSIPAPTPFTYWDIPVTAATFASFDIWLSSSDSFDSTNPTPTLNGGLYHAFHDSWDNPSEAGSKASWSQAFVLNTDYFDTGLGSIVTVGATTHLLSFEDVRNIHSDSDYSDLVLGIQIIREGGRPNTGVPEPKTYGVIGAAALLAIITVRRRLQK
jgi:hypothetical protein